MLRTLLNRDHPVAPSSTLSSGSRDVSAGIAFNMGIDRNAGRMVDGETSLMAHSRKARRVIEHLLQSTPSMSSDPEVIDALKALHTAMQGPSETETSLLQPVPSGRPQEYSRETLPPQEAVLNILRGAQAADCLFFSIWLPFFTPAEFERLCDQLYSDFDSCSPAIRTIVCGGIHYMFVEYLSACKIPYDSAYWSYAQSFKIHFESCLRHYSVLSMPTFDNILALVFGAGHAIQVSEFASAWPLVSAAANMCQALGWHRTPDSHSPVSKARNILFWLIYYLDKCLSLRLARSSNIQDFDLTLGYPEEPVEKQHQSWHLWFTTLIDIGAAHGLIYEHLFSPGSMSYSPKQRSQRVLELAIRLDNIVSKNNGIVDVTVYRRQYMFYLVKFNAVVIGCLRTLVYLAASSSGESADFVVDPRCLLAARSTLHYHQDVVDFVQDKQDGSANDYASWTILNCPFTPFIVLFSHVIVSFGLEDLRLMEAFTTSLQSLNMRDARPMLNFRVLCEAFLLLATRYIRMSTKRLHDQNLSLGRSSDGGHASPPSSDARAIHIPTGEADASYKNDNSGSFNFLPPFAFDDWLSGRQDFHSLGPSF